MEEVRLGYTVDDSLETIARNKHEWGNCLDIECSYCAELKKVCSPNNHIDAILGYDSEGTFVSECMFCGDISYDR